ncbi:MAG TPA: LuxR C-terminal-related transcriptional regulator [Sandaracinaceae bacterium LLY-WYZ-13_1]|nr:LuxR C-terminal-related transcriptional regulator [Sandaracinaceae bacterium LLY-WYZ-13_1]
MDWVGVVESAYRLQDSLQGWLEAVVDRCEPALDEGLGTLGYLFEHTPRGVLVRAVTTRGSVGSAEQVRARTEGAPVDAMRVLLDRGDAVGSTCAVLEPFGLAAPFLEALAADTGGRARDVVGLVAHDGEELGLVLGGARPERASVPAATARRWSRVLAHLGAGCRLQRRLLRAPAAPEAVLTPDGRPVHLEPPARRGVEGLRHAARQIDRARGRLRHSPDEALAIWKGLVEGRWSLVDRFESDGRRFVLAHRNDPRLRDPRGLSPRERHVAEELGRGRTMQEIAYDLGVTPSAVGNAAARARRKLGARSLTELVTFFAPAGLRARLTRFERVDEPFAVAALPALEALLDPLPPAERAVARLLLEGHTTRSIAARRGTHERTVANQVARIYRRFGVASRTELAARVLSPPDVRN